MKRVNFFASILVASLCASSASAYKVWLGTHKWEHAAAENLDQWDMAIEKIEGINYVLLDARPDYPDGDGSNVTDRRTMIGRIDQSIPGMAEISRSQFSPARNVSLASRMANEFATARANGGYEIDIIMLYDEAANGTVHEWTADEAQDVRNWLNTNGHTDVSLVFRLTNNSSTRLALAQNALFDGGTLIEASATRWVEDRNNVHTLLNSLWTNSRTRDRNIYFQIPRSESPGSASARNNIPSSPMNQYVETRRMLWRLKDLMGEEFMRSDQVRFLVCNYGDTYPTYPETSNNDTRYVNSKSGVALSLIEQRPIFEGRTGVVNEDLCISYDRYEVSLDPTSGLVAHWPLDEMSGTVVANTAGSSYTAVIENGATWGHDDERDSFVSFDGINDRIATTFTYALHATNDFTWAWWAKSALPPADATQKGSIMVGNRYGNTGSESFEFIKFTPQGAQFADTDDSGTIEKYAYADIPQNQWHHYAMVKTGTSYQWYIDGVAQGAPSILNYNETSPLPFFIGGDTDDKPNEHFKGFIDDVALYRQALTPPEIDNVINGIYLPTITLVTLGSAVNSIEPTVWSDGEAPHSGADYIIPNTGNVKGEGGTTTFAGASLTILPGGKYQVRSLAGSSQVTTVKNLILEGGTGTDYALLAAGTGTGATNVLAGKITNSGASKLLTYGGTTARSLHVLSQIAGDGILQVVGEGAIIDNTANTFSGTWEVDANTTLTFNNGGAVGAANIDVRDGGTLQILGDWNAEASLIVADTAGTTIALGSSSWIVSDFTIGDVSITEGTYTVSELNALGNTVFSGTGVLRVGLPPAYVVIASWEQWAATSSPATFLSNGINATATTADFGITKWGASTDGTFGSLASPAASALNDVHAEGLRKNGAVDISIDFTIENSSGNDIELEKLYFDALLKTANTGPKRWNLAVISGSFTTGQVVDEALDYSSTGSDLADYAVNLSSLADPVLDAGSSVVFRLSFTGGDASNSSNVDMDNVALTGGFLAGTTPVDPPAMVVEKADGNFTFSWSESGFKLQICTNLSDGAWFDYDGGISSPVTISPTNSSAFFRLIEQ